MKPKPKPLPPHRPPIGPVCDYREERIAICVAEGVPLERAKEIAENEFREPKQLNFGDLIE